MGAIIWADGGLQPSAGSFQIFQSLQRCESFGHAQDQGLTRIEANERCGQFSGLNIGGKAQNDVTASCWGQSFINKAWPKV